MMPNTGITCRNSMATMLFIISDSRMVDLVNILHEVRLRSYWRDYGLYSLRIQST